MVKNCKSVSNTPYKAQQDEYHHHSSFDQQSSAMAPVLLTLLLALAGTGLHHSIHPQELLVESLDFQGRLEVLDAAKYTEENVLDQDQKNQLFKSLKKILEDRETWESSTTLCMTRLQGPKNIFFVCLFFCCGKLSCAAGDGY